MEDEERSFKNGVRVNVIGEIILIKNLVVKTVIWGEIFLAHQGCTERLRGEESSFGLIFMF